MGHKMCGLGLVLLVEGRRAKVRWQGDYGTYMQMAQTLIQEVAKEFTLETQQGVG